MALPIRRILVGTDFSELADGALAYAVELAKVHRASITLLHAYELPIVGFPEGSFVVAADVASRLMNAAQESLKASAQRHRDADVPIETVLRDDAAFRAIAALASEIHADLVVVGTHGRTGLAHALLGSVSEKVVRTCPVPVLVWRTESKK